MNTGKFSIAEFIIQSEISEDWNAILATVERYFIYEIMFQTENYLHLSVMIQMDDDSKLIQKIAKQIYGKVVPYGRVKATIIDIGTR